MRRRGTIERRDDYQFRASITVKGKRFRKTFGSEGDAEAWLRSIESELLTNRFAAAREAEAITLSEALDRYESHIAANHPKAPDHLKKLKTVRVHLARMKLLERPLNSIPRAGRSKVASGCALLFAHKPGLQDHGLWRYANDSSPH